MIIHILFLILCSQYSYGLSPAGLFSEEKCLSSGNPKGMSRSCEIQDQVIRWGINITCSPRTIYMQGKKWLSNQDPTFDESKAQAWSLPCIQMNVTIRGGRVYARLTEANVLERFWLPEQNSTFIIRSGTEGQIKCCTYPFEKGRAEETRAEGYPRGNDCIKQSVHVPLDEPLSGTAYADTMILCVNLTKIANYPVYLRAIWYILGTDPVIKNDTLVRLPSTCVPVGIKRYRILYRFNITFPAKIQNCNLRTKRAWYDTLMGGMGTGLGVLNSIDIETLTNKMSSAGQDMARVVTMQADWMPTVFSPLLKDIKWNREFLSLVNRSLINTLYLTQNVSSLFNWTECSIRTIYQQQQKGMAKTQLMTGNMQVYRRIFKIPEELWLRLHSKEVYCADNWCWGEAEAFSISSSEIMCKFFILSVPLGNSSTLWTPHFEGKYIALDNKTHDLSLCDSTDNGIVCPQTTYVPEACQLGHPTSVCSWTLHNPEDDVFIEVAPQVICMITYDPVITGMYQLPNPFSGCLLNVTHLIWKNKTYVFYKDQFQSLNKMFQPFTLPPHNLTISIQRIINIINDTERLGEHLKQVDYSAKHAQMQTVVEADQLKYIATQLKENLEHHWWDVFTGKSPSTTGLFRAMLHPILAILIVLALMILWNCYLSHSFRKRMNRLTQVQLETWGK